MKPEQSTLFTYVQSLKNKYSHFWASKREWWSILQTPGAQKQWENGRYTHDTNLTGQPPNYLITYTIGLSQQHPTQQNETGISVVKPGSLHFCTPHLVQAMVNDQKLTGGTNA